jgi:hypothetical protein
LATKCANFLKIIQRVWRFVKEFGSYKNVFGKQFDQIKSILHYKKCLENIMANIKWVAKRLANGKVFGK